MNEIFPLEQAPEAYDRVGAALDAKMNWPASIGGKFTETSVGSRRVS